MDYRGKNQGIKDALNDLFRAIVARDEREAAVQPEAAPCCCCCCQRVDHRGKPRLSYRELQARRENDLVAARRIAGDMSMQTGKNYQNFTSGRYDHAFGVRTALAAIAYGREHP